jgi:two-component system, LuxR family, sensor kinase FixL
MAARTTQSSPPSAEESPAGDGGAGYTGTLHGRMLQVSRLATIGEMAAGVAHELNQPLTAIANYAQACDRLLARPAANLEDIHTALREIAAQAVRAGDILRRLRSLARSQPMRRESAGINAVIGEIRDLLTADARAHRGNLKFELAPGLPPVLIDAVQLQHVIVNLVRNGLEAQSDATSETRELCLKTGLTAGGEVEILICDNGPGLSAQALERLFDPFFSTKPDGTGLGLAISNTVVRAHDGSLGHRPNEPRGACFYIRLPAEAAGAVS